jgi:hypothetical protein
MAQHFNQLDEGQQERLAVLIEECSEVIQAGTKILRHGYDSHHPFTGENNRIALEREIADLLHILKWMYDVDISKVRITERLVAGKPNAAKYMHHQDNAKV